MSMSMSMSSENQTTSPFYFYKISCREKDNKSFYIGKTKNYAIRYSTHKSYAKHSNIKLYQYIREHGGFENFTIEVIHKCVCDEMSSIFLELHFINDYRSKGYEMLNVQVPNTYPKQEYKHDWQADNMFLKDMVVNNNALDTSIKESIQWFNAVERSWNKKAYTEGRLFKCDEYCGH